MMKKFLTTLFAIGSMAGAWSQTVLTPGDMAVIGFNGDDPDVIKMVNLVNIAAGTQIKITDNGYNGTALATTEGTDTWTAATDFPAGTIHTFTPTTVALGTTGDQIFLYQGTAAAPTFIFGLSSNPWVTGSISTTTSRKPATLTTGSTALAFSTERDNGTYTIVSNNAPKATLLTNICNQNNWNRTDTRISTFPLWMFSFGTMATEPTVQPSNMAFTNIKSYNYTVAFTAASPAPAGYLVLRSEGSVPSAAPVDGVGYVVGDVIGNAVVMSSGTAITYLQRSVVANTTYYYAVYSFNGSTTSTNYLQTAPLTGSVTSLSTMEGTYFSAVSPLNTTFVTDLQNRVRSPYTKVSYDLYDETMVAEYASREAPGGLRSLTCIYSGQTATYSGVFAWTPNTIFSREHTWCVSWMPSGGGTSLNEYADQHHLFPINQNNANAVRSNHPLGVVATPISTYLEGKYGYDAAGNTVYEPRASHKGDAARALLYMAMRYNGVSGFNWTFNNLNTVILPGLAEDPQDLNLLLSWHNSDLPDRYEIARNDYVQSIQQNRNPFVDHPDWVNYINFNTLTYQAPVQAPMLNGALKMQQVKRSAADVIVWPNPSESEANLTIDAMQDDVVSLTIFDLTGKMLYMVQSPILAGSTTIPLEIEALPSGFYVVHVMGENIREDVKFRKQ
jgi:endonuclease I